MSQDNRMLGEAKVSKLLLKFLCNGTFDQCALQYCGSDLYRQQ